MAQEKENFLGRWSRLKEQDRKELERPAAEAPVAQKPESQEDKAPELPPLDQLTPQSEFSGFMHPKVDDAVRRVALKKLFSDPHFNVPDPYEAYSGDWTVGEAIPNEMLATLNQARTHLFSDEEKKKKDEEEKKLAEQNKPKDDEPGRQDT